MPIEMTIKGLMVDPITSTPIVVLKDSEGEHILPIWVGVSEANAIALQIENITPPRPMTHDLLRDIIEAMDARVERIVVSELKDNTFYARIHLKMATGIHLIDARPSDAIALALRTKAPIFVEEGVMAHASKADIGPDRSESERLQRWLESLKPEDLGKWKM